METVWDWLTVFTFAGLATLLLQRSSEAEPSDKLWQYAPPAIGCMIANQLGNDISGILGIVSASAVLLASIAYIFIVLKVKLPGQK